MLLLARSQSAHITVWVALGLTVGACDGTLLCPGVLRADNLVVVVMDRDVGTPAAEGASGSARSGSREEMLHRGDRNPEGVLISLKATVTPGTYEVTVRNEGYEEWVRSGVVVESTSPCGIAERVELVAELVPIPTATSMTD